MQISKVYQTPTEITNVTVPILNNQINETISCAKNSKELFI